MGRTSQSFHHLDNIHVYRALPQAPAAAHTAENSPLVYGEILELMQKPLAKPLLLGGPGLTGRHDGKV